MLCPPITKASCTGAHKIHIRFELLKIFPLNMIYVSIREFTQDLNKSAKDSLVVTSFII